jgi:hypothetical protein
MPVYDWSVLFCSLIGSFGESGRFRTLHCWAAEIAKVLKAKGAPGARLGIKYHSGVLENS